MDRPPAPPSPLDALDKLGALCEPARRDLYFFVASEGREVSRDEAAAALNLRRGLVAHHLDRLAEDGLLEVEYRRLTGRSGPGAGRPSKLYRVAPARHELSIPPSNARLVALLLARAVAGAGRRARAAAIDAAREAGAAIGAAARTSTGARSERRAALVDALRAYGYRPATLGDALVLENCPYAPMSETHRDLVCGMNMAMIEAAVDTLGLGSERCALVPDPERCCVRVSPWPDGSTANRDG